jgi:hypothetical protein
MAKAMPFSFPYKEGMEKKCKACDKPFVDKTLNQNKICCSKSCVCSLWYAQKKNKNVKNLRKKRTEKDYELIANQHNADLVKVHVIKGQTRLELRCRACNHAWKCSVDNLFKTLGGCMMCAAVKRSVSLSDAISMAKEREFTLEKSSYRAACYKAIWTCNRCKYVWHVALSHLKRANCPGCRISTENKVREIFEELFLKSFPIAKPQWLKNPESKSNGLLQLDGYNEELKLAFEYDGEFHFMSYWGSKTNSTLAATQKRDRAKDRLCLEKGVILIRIPYWEKKDLKSFIVEQLKSRGLYV